MFKSILPQASFARFAEGRLDFDGDDEEYSHYLTRFADQQSLARRLMGGNVRHYNSKQQEKDAGVVNRGDFLFFGGARTKGQAEGPPPKPIIPAQPQPQAKPERKRIAAKIVTKAPEGEIPYEERNPVAVFDTTQVVDLSANALKKDLFGEQIKKVLKYGCKFDLSNYDSVKMDDELKKINEDLQKVNYKDTFRIASAAFNRYDYVCKNMKKKANNPDFIEEVRTYCSALDELSSLINMYQRKKQPMLKAAKKLNLTPNKTEEQNDDLFELEDTLGMYTDYEREITALKFYTEQIRESYYGKLKRLDEDEYEFTQTGMNEIQDAYPGYKLSNDQLLQIYKNRKAKKDDFDGFDKEELARIQKGEAIQVVSDDEKDDDVNNVVGAIIPADTTKPKTKKTKKQEKNPDLIDVKSTPVKNDTVKDTTGSNGVAFDAQPALEQDKRSVSHEQRVGAANDVSSILQASKPKVQYDVRQRRLAHRRAFQERVKSRIDPLSDEKLKEAKNNKRKLVEEHELEEEFERPEHDRQSKKYWDRIQKVKQEKLEKQREENRRAEIAMDELITEEEMAERKRVEKRHEEYWRKREEKWNAEKEREKQLQIVPYVDPQSQKIKRDMDEYQWEAVDDNVATNLQVKEEWQGNKPKIAKAHANLENALRKKWFRQTWLGQKIWRPAQKKVAVEAVQDAAAANVADGPVAAAVAAKTAVEAEAQADEANLVSNSSYGSVRKPISLIEQELDDLERELDEPELVPAEPALPEFVPPADPAEPVAPAIEPLSEDEDEKPEKKSDPYDRMMDLLAGDSKNATKLMKYKKFKAQQEKERNKRLEDNLKWFSDRMQERRGHSSLGSLSGFKKWDPFSQPLNKNFRNQKMENRLQQTVPPYDLPKNYPIYGGAMPGYPRVNSVPYPVYARRGRTGRRTNYEKYGVPSVRMYQQMLRNGLPPNVVARAAGRPRAVPQPPVEEQNIGPTPQYMPEYDDGPTYAEDKSYDYGEQVQRIAKNLMWGPPRRYTTGNQIVGSVLPNTTSGMPSAYYMGAKALDMITPEGQTDKEKLENMLANVKITQMVEDVKSEDDKKRLREMAKNFGNLNESGWKKALRWGATGASLGLKGLGVLSENFWPMHDAYYRYKTMSSLGGIGKSLLGMMPRGFGYRRRKKRSNKKCRKGKVCYGGMIIPPKSLKKMFEENKCDLKY